MESIIPKGRFLSKWPTLSLLGHSIKIFLPEQELFVNKFQWVTHYHLIYLIGRKIAALIDVNGGTGYDGLILPDWKLRFALGLTL